MTKWCGVWDGLEEFRFLMTKEEVIGFPPSMTNVSSDFSEVWLFQIAFISVFLFIEHSKIDTCWKKFLTNFLVEYKHYIFI